MDGVKFRRIFEENLLEVTKNYKQIYLCVKKA